MFIIDGWGQPTGAHRLYAGDQFNRPGSRDKMAHHTLDTAHRNMLGCFSKHMFHSKRFDPVIDLGARAVGIDIAYLGWRDASILQRTINTGNGAPPLGVAIGNAESVGS